MPQKEFAPFTQFGHTISHTEFLKCWKHLAPTERSLPVYGRGPLVPACIAATVSQLGRHAHRNAPE